MNNNIRYDGYGYPDMRMVNSMFMQNNPNMNMNPSMNMNPDYNQMDNYNQNLANPNEGFIKGNLFNNLYDQYKNHKPASVTPSNEQAELLLNVDQYSFAAHEIKLYLDVFPDDKQMISLYNQYQKMAQDAIKQYETKYGPILSDSPSKNNTFSWEAYSWPWEMEEM